MCQKVTVLTVALTFFSCYILSDNQVWSQVADFTICTVETLLADNLRTPAIIDKKRPLEVLKEVKQLDRTSIRFDKFADKFVEQGSSADLVDLASVVPGTQPFIPDIEKMVVRWGVQACPHGKVFIKGYGVGLESSSFRQSGADMSGLTCFAESGSHVSLSSAVNSGPTLSPVQIQLQGGQPSMVCTGKHNGNCQDWTTLHGKVIPCVMCSYRATDTITLVGKTDCDTPKYTHWTLVYSGYMMSQYDAATHSSSGFICVDPEMAHRPHPYGSMNITLGSPKYSFVRSGLSHNSVIPCAVCVNVLSVF